MLNISHLVFLALMVEYDVHFTALLPGMLQNQDGMLLERIHAMLKMVVAGGSGGVRYDLSIVQLRKFLQTLITADTLEMVDGLYKLRK